MTRVLRFFGLVLGVARGFIIFLFTVIAEGIRLGRDLSLHIKELVLSHTKRQAPVNTNP